MSTRRCSLTRSASPCWSGERPGTTWRVRWYCRSGTRAVEAGKALERAGFAEVVNVLHGFEGDLDAHFQRGRLNGWRFDGLPWEQL